MYRSDFIKRLLTSISGVSKNLSLVLVFKFIAEDTRHCNVQLVKIYFEGTERAHIKVTRSIIGLSVEWLTVCKCRSYELMEQESILVKWDLSECR